MNKISKQEASSRIFKIAKSVAESEALNGALSPLQEKQVRSAVAKILAASEVDEKTLDKISEELEGNFSESAETKTEVEDIKNKEADEVEDIEETEEVKEFITKNKMTKLKSLEKFISKLADRGVYFKTNTLNVCRLGQLLTAIEQAMKACVEE